MLCEDDTQTKVQLSCSVNRRLLVNWRLVIGFPNRDFSHPGDHVNRKIVTALVRNLGLVWSTAACIRFFKII